MARAVRTGPAVDPCASPSWAWARSAPGPPASSSAPKRWSTWPSSAPTTAGPRRRPGPSVIGLDPGPVRPDAFDGMDVVVLAGAAAPPAAGRGRPRAGRVGRLGERRHRRRARPARPRRRGRGARAAPSSSAPGSRPACRACSCATGPRPSTRSRRCTSPRSARADPRAPGCTTGRWAAPASTGATACGRSAGAGRDASSCGSPIRCAPRTAIAPRSPRPLLLAPALPDVQRVTARVAATRRDRLTGRLPMLRQPHPEGVVGAIRVEVRGRRGQVRDAHVLGVIDRPAIAAGTVAAVAAVAAGAGGLERAGARAGWPRSSPILCRCCATSGSGGCGPPPSRA